MTGLFGEHFQESALGAAIAVEEWVNGIELAAMFGGARRELFGHEATQIIVGLDRREAFVHLRFNEFGLAKRRAAPGRDRPVFTGPIVNILQYVTVNLAIAIDRDGQIVRQRQQSVGGMLSLESLKLVLVLEIFLVPVYVRAWITIRVTIKPRQESSDGASRGSIE